MKTYKRVYAQVDLDAILHIMEQMRRIIDPHTKIMGVIKADGYGHGAIPIGRELEKLGYVWGYATATVEEAQVLRRNGLSKPILTLGHVSRSSIRRWRTRESVQRYFLCDRHRKWNPLHRRQGKR